MSLSFILIGVSLALFAYWFRYSCILILHTQTAEDYSGEVCRANGLSFELVRGQLESEQNPNLKILCESLERDYAIVTTLLDRLSPAGRNQHLLEINLLRANFRVTRLWFQVSHQLGLRSSYSALAEMAETINHFANTFGQQNSLGAAA